MRKILCVVLVAIALLAATFTQPALAADTALGAKVFNVNCAACHQGGMNVVMAPKNLKKEALKQYGMDSPEAIINQVTNGKGVMPAFKSKLKPEEIEAVAAYVLEQSDKGWGK
ncbi:MAG: c-type cytochrome [Cyanobacteria bacterium CRU_2_1]|nr:c-type cytochrome [Cyanobacteria bacterium CRU_2_1]